MPKVLIATPTLAGLEGAFTDLLRREGFDVVHPRQRKVLTEPELLGELRGVSACIAGFEPYTRRVIESSPELRVIARNGVGYDAVDLAAATEHGIPVTVTPGANHESVAEHAFALLLAVARAVVPQNSALHAGGWRREAGVNLRGRTLGLVGLGRIGREMAQRAAAFRMKILAYEPFPDAAFVAQHQIALMPLDQLLAESDFVSLHVPLSPESKNMIDARALRLMKPTAFLINTARGGVVCENSLAEALREGRLAGAGLDVFAEEPPPAGHPLLAFENVVCTAHAAGIDLKARDDMAQLAASAIVTLCRGEWPADQVVNPQCRQKFEARYRGAPR
ncbi:MAG: phosphoglycerate dehydrogenase [Planctomycetia bacterium]|nr:phosphoglycerate dehydrogenase [Planctomycetia bacterium]